MRNNCIFHKKFHEKNCTVLYFSNFFSVSRWLDSHIISVFNLCFDEKPPSHKHVVENEKSILTIFSGNCGY